MYREKMEEKGPIIQSPLGRAFRGMDGLKSLKQVLALVQAAQAMALEGINRSTAAEVLQRAINDFGVDATPSVVGQMFSNLNIGKATTHGKTRLVLDSDELKSIKERISKVYENTAKDLEQSLNEFEGQSERVKALEDRWKEILQIRARERELVQLIQQDRQRPSRLPDLEQEMDRIKAEVDKCEALEKQCKELSLQIKKAPFLEAKKADLDKALSSYKAEEAKITQQEARLGEALDRLKLRSAWVQFVDLQYSIQKARAELEELSQQLGEKRTLIDKLLGRNKGIYQ
jgi:DNA repair exonuclease SbcCD ATPase subunit